MISAAALIAFTGMAQAGMIIEQNNPIESAKAPVASKHKEATAKSNLIVNPKTSKEVVSKKAKSSIKGEGGINITAKSLAKVGPKGFGKGVSIDTLLQQVKPETEFWSLSCPTGICSDAKVDWSSDGTEAWMNLFYRTVHDYDKDLNVSFNEENKNVTVSYPDQKIMNWTIHKERTLKENVSDWSSLAGWQMEWDMDSKFDWETGSTFAVNGTFKSSMDKLFAAYASKGIYLEAVYYKNRVLRIVRHSSMQTL